MILKNVESFEDKEKVIKSLEWFLSNLSKGDFCGSWKFLGLANKRYETPGGSWKSSAYQFSKEDRVLNIAVDWLKSGYPYVVLESENRRRQTANYSFYEFSNIKNNDLNVPDNLLMSHGRRGRVSREKLIALYDQIGFNSPYFITHHKLSNIDYSLMVSNFLNWGEIRDKSKEIIESDPGAFFGDSPKGSDNESEQPGSESQHYSINTEINSDSVVSDDLLNREPFAHFLALKFSKLWNSHYSDSEVKKGFVTHLYGEWGAGKSTFLELLKNELVAVGTKDSKGWVVVEFNAWENQHVNPTWWPLMNTIISGAIKQNSSLRNGFSIWLKLKELLRKLTSGWGADLWALSVILLLSLVAFAFLPSDTSWSESLAQLKVPLTTITIGITLLVSIFRSLLPNTSYSAELYQRFTKDPLSKVRRHFSKFLDDIDRPIMVYIDDLDRCREGEVVAILESLHLLFNDKRVFYIVAADKKWISSCFQYEYKNIVDESDNGLTGFMFVEKLFQLSIGLPVISNSNKRMFLEILLGKGKKETFNLSDQEKEKVQQSNKYKDFSSMNLENPFLLKMALEHSLSDEFEKDIEHRLLRYCDFLQPNPRFIKLLVNTFGVNAVIAMTSGIRLDDKVCEDIVAWTILSLRYPLIAQDIVESDLSIEDFVESNQLPLNVSQLLLGQVFDTGAVSSQTICVLTGQPYET